VSDPLAHLLVAAALILTGVQTISLIWTSRIASDLAGLEGGDLAKLLRTMARAVFVAQILSLARAILIDTAPDDTLELRVVLFILEEIVVVTASIVVMLRARRLTS